jgi:hypothetical protein
LRYEIQVDTFTLNRENTILFMLVTNPLAWANMSRIQSVTWSSCIVSFMKTVASSAYKEALKESQALLRLEIRPACWAFWNSLCRCSIERRNNIGDRGSPCLTPLQWRILLPGIPFNKYEEDAVHHNIEI